MNTLQTIQNSALRIILRKPIMTKTRISELHVISNLEYIKERFYSLSQRYITKAIVNKNPMIAQVIEEYQRYKGGRVLNSKTLLCELDLKDPNQSESDTSDSPNSNIS
jgi:hypothetical protein